ncbi:MAG: leucine-rich repeat domain-containing protein, partial [Clostridiales bacterium]|nr:leucine-rich repeat domain-containing protein [Clostridiales bacterium]
MAIKTHKSGVSFEVSADGRLTAGANSLEMHEDVAVPEGVVSIGAGAMGWLRSRRLTMPSTLKVVEREAFMYAVIDEIDFGDCKLERIEDWAFHIGGARTELPDTVEYLGTECTFRIAKEKKIKLPKSLKYISRSSIKLDDICEVEVQEGMIRLDSNLVNWLDFRLNYKKWVVLRVFRDDKELYRFVHNERWRVDTSKYNYIGPEGMIYENYDNNFDNISSVQCKALMAAYRLVWPTDLPEDIEKKYRIYVKDHYLGLIKGKEEDIESIRLFCSAGLITPFRLKQLLENASAKNNIELAACLMEEL